MPVEIRDLNGVPFECVKLSAVDFNGKEMDGNPFSAVPDWLREMSVDGRLDFNTDRQVDYACFTLKLFDERTQVVWPGDVIIYNSEVGVFVLPEKLATSLMTLKSDKEV